MGGTLTPCADGSVAGKRGTQAIAARDLSVIVRRRKRRQLGQEARDVDGQCIAFASPKQFEAVAQVARRQAPRREEEEQGRRGPEDAAGRPGPEWLDLLAPVRDAVHEEVRR